MMKIKLLPFLFSLISFCALAQPGSIKPSAIYLVPVDSSLVSHATGSSSIYYNTTLGKIVVWENNVRKELFGQYGIRNLAHGGTGSALSDPGANKIMAWDDTDNSIGFWSLSGGLTYDHSTHTLSSSTTPSGSAGGDLSGTYPNPTLSKATNLTSSRAVFTDASKNLTSSIGDGNDVVLGNGTLKSSTSDDQVLRRSGGSLGFGNILPNSITVPGETLLGNSSAFAGDATGLVLGTGLAFSGGALNVTGAPPTGSAGGDLTGTYPNPTIATVNSNTGSFGSSTQVGTFTVNAKGLITAAGNTTVTPALASITSGTSAALRGILSDELGTGSALFDGATPTSFILTNATGLPLTTGITGILPVANGGTGVSTGAYLLASGGTLSGPNTITGSSTNIVKYVFPSLNTTQVDGAGLWLANTTSAANAAQQISPSIVLEGKGWKSNSVATSESVKFKMDVLPVQGATGATGIYRLFANTVLNGNVLVNSISSTGDMVMSPTQSTSSITMGSNSHRIRVSGNSFIFDYTNGGNSGMVAQLVGNYVATNSSVITTAQNINPTTGSTISSIYGTTSNFNPPSGGQNFASIHLTPVINTSGTWSGNIYGSIYNPTLTSTTGLVNHYGAVTAATTLNGFGTLTPASTLETAGSFGANTRTITTSTTVLPTDYMLRCDATSGAIVVTLPSASGATGRIYYIKKVDASANTVTFTADGGTVTLSTQYSVKGVQSNGTTYDVISN